MTAESGFEDHAALLRHWTNCEGNITRACFEVFSISNLQSLISSLINCPCPNSLSEKPPGKGRGKHKSGCKLSRKTKEIYLEAVGLSTHHLPGICYNYNWFQEVFLFKD